MDYKIGIIGGGNMGSAIVRGGIRAGIFKPTEVVVAEIDQPRREALQQEGCAVTGDPKATVSAGHVLLAVKPQAFASVAEQISPLPASTTVISIMAGLNSASIRTKLGGQARIVRAMPNVPCQIGAGMTAVARGAGARAGDESFALAIFNALGRTVLVDESMMHAATAVSGSGPAYVFLLAEAMERAAMNLGFDHSTAHLLVEQTVMGAGRLLNESNRSAAELRQSVTSPGGTTAAAMDVFSSRQFAEIVVEALAAARDRGMELDRE